MNFRSKLPTTAIILLLAASFFLTTGFSFIYALQQASPGISSAGQDINMPFSDVNGNWAEAAIAEMYAKDVMRGYSDSTFKPKKPVTYLEAVVMIDKLLWGQPLVDATNSNAYLHDQFNIPAWAVEYVASAMKHNIMTWNELQKASDQQPMTREDAAVLAVNALELTKLVRSKKDVTLPFGDTGQISEKLRPFVALAYQRRIIDGYPDGTFRPSNTLSRAEMAVLLRKIANQIPSVNAAETSGFIKAINIIDNTVTLTSDDGKDSEIKLPENVITYLDDSPSTLNQLTPGNHLRIISNSSANLTVLLAESVLPDNGNEIAMEQVNPVSVPGDIAQWVETNKIAENYLYQSSGNDLYFLATRGEKMYGGYSVEIKKITSTADDKGIYYRVWLDRSDPARDAVKLTVISYPYALVKVPLPDQTIGSVTFVDQLNQVISEAKVN